MENSNPLPLTILAEKFAAFPSIGMKTAVRLAYHVMNMPQSDVQAFADALICARNDVHSCKICQNFTDSEICPLCSDAVRDASTILVVETPKDVSAFERTHEYHGMYHVLHGLISPLDGVTPDMLRVRELLARLHDDAVAEIILAVPPTVLGDTTAMYIAKLLHPIGIKTTRIGFGLPIGAQLEYADEVTLFKALENRNEI